MTSCNVLVIGGKVILLPVHTNLFPVIIQGCGQNIAGANIRERILQKGPVFLDLPRIPEKGVQCGLSGDDDSDDDNDGDDDVRT